MDERRTEPRWLRFAFGKPRIRHGAVWLTVAAAFLVVAIISEPNPWRYVIAALWAVMGAAMLIVAVRDLRRGRGAYAVPVFEPED